MKVLVIGGGGREHTLVWKIKQNPQVKKIYCAPGNAGIAREAECVDIDVADTKKLINFASKNKIDMTIAGPEKPLVNGIVDDFEENGLPIFGPSKRAAELEGSKAFCKDFMNKYGIPTARYRVFEKFDKAKSFLDENKGPIVVKADGLAAGKGVLICHNYKEALNAVDTVMNKRQFGEAGSKVVLEEMLTGDEVSVLALTDGEHIVYMVPSQDHKRIFDNDQGPNTGGMGAYAPTPYISDDIMDDIKKKIIEPTVKGMALEDRPYRGVLYAGLMITKDGPRVLEYNCRFGDPETQVILPMAESDLIEAILAARNNQLDKIDWKNRDGAAVCVVIASGGYPGPYEKGKKIHGLDRVWDEDVYVFHAGTKKVGNDIVTNGGRVLGVTALDSTIARATNKVYKSVSLIAFDGAYYRKDIAHRVLG